MSELLTGLTQAMPRHPQRLLLPGEKTLALRTNNYRFQLTQAQTTFVYSIDLSPIDPHADTDPLGRAIRQGRHPLKALFGRFVRCGNLLFSKSDIRTLPTLRSEFERLLQRDTATDLACLYTINHEEVGLTVHLDNLDYALKFKCLGAAESVPPESLLQFANIVLGFVQKELGLRQLGSCPNFFNPNSPQAIRGFPVSIWPGYFASVNLYREGLQLRLDKTHKLVRTDTVLEYIRSMRNRAEIEANLDGCLVMTTYGQRFIYRVESVMFAETPKSTFESSAGLLSYAQYYRDQYDITVSDLSQPLLEVRFRNKPAIRLIPELCVMTGLSPQLRKNRGFTTTMMRLIKQTPDTRETDINEYCQRLGNSVGARDWGFSVKEPVVTNGIILQEVKVQVGKQEPLLRVRNAAFSLQNKQLAGPVPVNSWKLFYALMNEEDAQKLAKGFKAAAQSYGVTVGKLTPVEVTGGIKGRLEDQFRDALRAKCQTGENLVVVLLPNFIESAYGNLKKILTVEKPVPSQVVMVSTVKRLNGSICGKILLQAVAKLGGELWRVVPPAGIPAYTMIVGIDVCHTGKAHEQSVLAFCATVNAHFTRYYNQVVFQKPRQEVGNDLALLFSHAFEVFYRMNGNHRPECVIVYRDGVAPGQYNSLLSNELAAVVSNVKELDKEWHPKLILAVVTKRVNARFFTQEHGNMPAGVVVEEGVVAPHYNFYMSSHSAGDGTLTPTHYNIIHDDSNLPSSVFENLTNALCFDYYNWTGGIRVPAPCQYAHKLAYLVGKHTKAAMHRSLECTSLQL